MGKRILGEKAVQAAVSAAAPAGAAGIDMAASFHGAAKTKRWLITVVVTVAPSDFFVWGSRSEGVANDKTDDIWGLFQDNYKIAPLGKIATNLPTGTFHFEIEGLGLFDQVYFQQGGGGATMVVTLSEILVGDRGN